MNASARHLRPWRKRPYSAAFLATLLLFFGWVVPLSWMYGRGWSADGGGTGGFLCPLVCAGLAWVGLAVPFLLARARAVRRMARAGSNEAALTLLRAGRYAEAAAVWEELAFHARMLPAAHALVVHNLGLAWLCLGHVRPGLALMERARATGWFSSRLLRDTDASARVGLALGRAVGGDLEGARAIVDALAPTLAPAQRSMTMLVDAIVAARQGQALAYRAEQLRQAESSLMPSHVRALRLLEAFTQTRAQGSAYRDAPLRSLGITPGELDFLSADWPELRSFMASHGLMAEPA